MKTNTIIFIFYLFFFNKAISQNESFIAVYPDSLKENANAIVKENLININIPSFDKMNVKTRRVITIFNEYGLKHMNAQEYFDKSTTINNIEAKIYNRLGVEIKKIKKKDFKESALSQGSIITDNRILYLEYVPIQYPFTLVFESETTTSNTAFIPSWSPIEAYFLSTVKTEIKIDFAEGVKFKYKEYNFDKRINKVVGNNHLEFSANNIVSIKGEQLSPSLRKFVPFVMFGLDEFHLEGVKGYANDWNTFGKWMYDSLLKETEEIPSETIVKIQNIIGTETDPIKKAKIIYNYVQNKTRYVSIQLGIGGWKPMLAKDVDRLGYGDCKALTNYTRSLLKAFNIPSYYTIVFGGEKKRNIDSDFVSMQGNHAVLGIPNKGEIIWLECTSQVHPFGFQGDFTDDRKVFIVSDDKAEIVYTKKFDEKINSQYSKSELELLENNTIKCSTEIISKGIMYDSKFMLEKKSKEEILKVYKDLFNNLNNKEFYKIEHFNDKDNASFVENISFEAKESIKKSGNTIILPLNLINQITFTSQKYKNRMTPFEIERGFSYVDNITVKIPENYSFENLPSNIEFQSEFGSYICSFESKDREINLNRTITIKEGLYDKDKYENYRIFRDQIAKYENAKVALKIN